MANVVYKETSENYYIARLATNFRISGEIKFKFEYDRYLTHPIDGKLDLTEIMNTDFGYSGQHVSLVNNIIVIDFIESMAAVSSYADIVFSQTTSSQDAFLHIVGYDDIRDTPVVSVQAFGQYPSSTTETDLILGVSVENHKIQQTVYLDAGGYRSYLTLHELMHTLGLRHPHDDVPGIPKLSTKLDKSIYTVMSYNHKPNSIEYGNPITPMALDVAALHYLYGAKSKATQDSSYRILDDGELMYVSENSIGVGRAFYCIWDTDGIDLIEYNGGHRVLINLNQATLGASPTESALALEDIITKTRIWADLPADVRAQFTDHELAIGGYLSSTFTNSTFGFGGGMRDGGYTIAHNPNDASFNAVIEDAKGGLGSDIIIGNETDNYLRGMDGDDFLFGGQGDDWIYGGAGDDIIYGGDGNNMIWGGFGDDIIWTGSGGDYTETQGGDGNDLIIAEDHWNYVDAGGQNDIVVIKGKGDYYGWSGSDAFDLTYFTSENPLNHIGGSGSINGEYSFNSLYTSNLNDFKVLSSNGKVELFVKDFLVDNIDLFAVGSGYDLEEYEWANNINTEYFSLNDIYTKAITGDIQSFGILNSSNVWENIISATNFSSFRANSVFEFELPAAEPGYTYEIFSNPGNVHVNYNGQTYNGTAGFIQASNKYFVTLENGFYDNTFDGDTIVSGSIVISKCEPIGGNSSQIVEQYTREFQTVIIDDTPYEWTEDFLLSNEILTADTGLYYFPTASNRGLNIDGHINLFEDLVASPVTDSIIENQYDWVA